MAIKDCEHEAWLESGICLICSPPDGWQHHAKCIDAHPDTCFPEDDEPHLYDISKRLCEECPVTSFCLEIGIEEKWGMWGGMTPDQRHKLVKSGQIPTERLERRKFLRVYGYLN